MVKENNTPMSRARAGIYGALLAAVPFAGNAQVLEEVVVTAQKREQSLQDVGIAVTAFTGDQIQQLGFTNSTDVANMSPGVFVSGSAAGQNAQFSVRGVTQSDFLDIIEGPTAIYLDEGYLVAQNGGTFGMFDIDRVEILKGPQGTLFGRNATGGLVNYVTRKPTDTVEGYADVTYGEYDLVTVQAAISGPLTDNLKARGSIFYRNHDEIIDNIYPFAAVGGDNGFGQDQWNDDTIAGRGQLMFDIGDDAEVYLMGHASHIEQSESSYQSQATVPVINSAGQTVDVIPASPTNTCVNVSPGGGCVDASGAPVPPGGRPVPGGDLFGYVDPDGDDFTTSEDFSPDDGNIFETHGVLGRLTWDLGWANLTAVSDYKKFDRDLIVDVDSAPVNFFVFNTITDTWSFTQEIRLDGETDRARWVGGFYFLHADADVTNGFIAPPGSIAIGPGGGPFSAPNTANLETDSYSLFGQVEYDITPELTFIGGLRVIQEEKDYSLQARLCPLGADITEHNATCSTFLPSSAEDPSGAAYTESTSDTLWAGKVQLDWTPTDDLLLYFGINRGVKAGAFNAPLPLTGAPLPQSDIGYDEEVLLSFEGGFKSTLWDGKARLNASAFYYDYEDFHTFSFIGVSGIVSNNDATNVGVEFDFTVSPIDGLDFMIGASYYDYEVEDVAVQPGVVRDVEPPFAPSFSAAGLLRYEFPALAGRIAAQMDFNYRSEIYHNINNFTANEYDDAIIGNARISWYSNDDAWQVAAFLNNIADERAGTIGFDLSNFCGCNENSFVPPQWWGVNVRYNFN